MTTFEAIYCGSNPIESGLYEEIQERATAYPFAFSTDREGTPIEGAEVWFAWNQSGLYVGAALEDSFLIAKNRADEELHFESGDVFELFVKPADDSYYWEMYATPFGNKTTLFFPREREDMILDQFLHAHKYQALHVASSKTPQGWKAEMWVPAEQLTALGAGWGPGAEWTLFCGRYNYNNEQLADPELSMAPALSATNYHLTAEYAALRFLD